MGGWTVLLERFALGSIAGVGDEKERSNQRTRVSGPSQGFAARRLQHATSAAEVSQNCNQEAESAEKEGCKLGVLTVGGVDLGKWLVSNGLALDWAQYSRQVR